MQQLQLQQQQCALTRAAPHPHRHRAVTHAHAPLCCRCRVGQRVVAAVPARHIGRLWPRGGLLVAAAQDYGASYDNLFKSKVFQSELVVREFDDIMGQLRQLSMMASRFPDFDLPGKEMFLDKMEENTERYKLFMKRLELCDDPAAREYLRYTNAQMMNGGFNYQVMFEGLAQSLKQYRHWIAEERRVSSDPVQHQAFLKAFRETWSGSALGAIDMGRLSQMASPEVVARAQKDPEFFKAIKEISENPGSMSKWMEHETIGPLVAAMWKAMMEGRQQRQA